jgi:Zn-dependent M16 (insulinase) family peptidase
MYKALLESGLGSTYGPGVGYDTTTKDSTFTIGVNGCSEEDVPKIERTILETLKKCMDEGIDSRLIESAIHQTEIGLKQVKSNYGLVLLSSLIPYSLHGTDPLVPLYINSYVDRLRSELATGVPVFQTLVRDFLWNNSHKVAIKMTPDPQFDKQVLISEEKKIHKIESSLKEEQKNQLVVQAEELLRLQEQKQNVDVLPTLEVKDISKEVEKVDYAISEQILGVPVHYIEQPTNGLSYLRIKLDINDLPYELRHLLPLYSRVFNRLGTFKHSHGDFDSLKDLYTTGGISCGFNVSCSPTSIENHSEQMVLKVGFLDRNLHHAMDILTELLGEVNFNDHSHISYVIQQNVKSRTENLVNEGVTYGVSLATSSLTSAANTYESLETLRHDCELAAQLINTISMQSVISDVSERLNAIHRHIFNKSKISILVHTSTLSSLSPQFRERIELLISSLSHTNPKFNSSIPKLPEEAFSPFIYQAFFTLPMQVNYVIESFRGASYTNPDYPVLTVLSEIMSHNFLHKEIREKGGAYGSGVQNDPHRGTISLYSYRDPNNLKTYQAFEKSIQNCLKGEFDQRLIDEAKLGAFQRIDKPVAAFDKGLAYFMYSNI